jgi:hypothetical protein
MARLTCRRLNAAMHTPAPKQLAFIFAPNAFQARSGKATPQEKRLG